MSDADEAVLSLYKEVWQWKLVESPELASFCGFHAYDDRWDDISEEAYLRREQCIRNFLKKAEGIDVSSCSKDVTLNYELLIDDLRSYLKGTQFKSYLMPINFIEGIHNDCNLTISYMKFNTEENFNTYISRLKKLPQRIEQVTQALKRGVQCGVVMSHYSVYRVPSLIDDILNSQPDKLGLLKPFSTEHPLMTPSRLDAFQVQAKHIVTTKVFEALKALKTYLTEEYFKHVRPKEGICCLENGEKWYQQCLDFHLSLSMTPQEVHDVGLKEIARIQEKVLKVGKEENLGETLEDIRDTIHTKQGGYFKTSDEVLEFVKDLCFCQIKPKLVDMFYDLPNIPLIIKPVPEFLKNVPAGFYLNGTPDGSREGSYCINTHNPASCFPFQLPALSLHEAEPGHHLQSIYILGSSTLPELRKFAEESKYYLAPGKFALKTAYVEGWGLYAEGLGDEMNMYENKLDLIGRYSYEVFRAARLVVDTGIHALGWSKEQGVKYLVQNTLASEAGAEKEVERYITWPGQACAYKIGELKIWELRRKAEAKLGAKFNLKEFHHRVLANGSLPLHVLESIIDKYIAEFQES
ncbi:hypothetical protein Bpfe_018106 [Biomphalaria pfeifferi]|uniref:DUF885 domain-containing protein n=1 Tax=Biomphalaria pfeifferi TaxID=112525 RepID=A0AAD8BDX5_BIOPF|nr:hypothetical protein Bpfe_018106 [Biomphalaria pfeifferi]